ncbi:hypothetical protein A5725_14345 [Mycobacterium kubicae]|uniref:DUF6542 domain-containing protein n=1 Tax=Mycobacterium kubicae TaxID=120959 RepID=UPI00080202A4|nr:DUF6542 domain-containing protein [Mycobacterium kubicae]OBF20727.1 hypothetical protein A5725_14345 [Mycobacterium kubicae]
MSAQRAGSAVEPSHRSIIPNIAGVPWWTAVLIAVTGTAIGYGIDAGHKELTHVFAGCYIAGCVAAVLAVRQAGVFTAVIQPPLILFCTVPGAYWLFHGGKVDKFKDLLINCGYPLIERFPLMLGTAGVVLLIGLVRWYFGMSHRRSPAAEEETAKDARTGRAERTPFLTGLIAKVRSVLATEIDGEEADPGSGAQPAHSRNRSARTSRTARSNRSTQRSSRTRSRHGRPPLDDEREPSPERPRRTSRRTAAGDFDRPDFDPNDAPQRAARPRRRPRPQGEPDLRAQPPRETRRDPYARRGTYERPTPRTSRFDPYDSYDAPEPAGRSESYNRYERRRGGYEPYEPHEAYPPRRRRPTPNGSGTNGSSTNGSGTNGSTHHPISQVRYRAGAGRTEPRSETRGEPRDEPRAERRSRSRAPRRPQAESWEYDI